MTAQPDTIPAPPVESENPIAELRKVIALLVEDRDRYKAEAEELRRMVDEWEKRLARYSIAGGRP